MTQIETTKNLPDLLSASPSRHLFALLANHGFAIASSRPKLTLINQLERHLKQPETLTSIIAQLDVTAQAALRALLAADGALPVHTFETRFGPIRPYRPWRKDEVAGADQPWRAPISTTETLWYLGLIYRHPPKPTPGVVQHYIIPTDLVALLTPLLHQVSQNAGAVDTAVVALPGRHGGLDHHLAIWLATLNERTIAPVHKQWLPPSLVALLCRRLSLDQDRAFTPIRSERHHPYLAFLHYLALAADLIAITPTAFQLTPTAWAWLQADLPTRQQQLHAAWHRAAVELAHRFHFRWEPLTPQARAFIREQLAKLPPDQPHRPLDLIAHWRLLDSRALLPGPRPTDWRDETTLYDPLAALLTGPLHWLGLITLSNDDSLSFPASTRRGTINYSQFSINRYPAPSSCTMPKQPPNTILAGINVQPIHLAHLARFCDWTIATAPTATPHTFTLAPDRIAQLAAASIHPAQLLAHLTAALGRPPSRRVISRLHTWALPGQQLRLRPLLVLEADTPDRLAQLRRHKLVRNRLGEVIAPNRIALNPTDAPALAQTLRTLGYHVEPPAPAPIDNSPPVPASTRRGPAAAPQVLDAAPLTIDNSQLTINHSPPVPAAAPRVLDAAQLTINPSLQYFLITLYQGLGQHLPLPIDLSWDLRQALRQQLTALQQASAESAAHTLLDQLQAALNGYLQLPAWHLPPTPDPEPIIRTALAQGHDIELRYWGPSDGHVTTRRVTPYWIETRHHTLYLIGWCHLRQQERTFRLDRIEAVAVM